MLLPTLNYSQLASILSYIANYFVITLTNSRVIFIRHNDINSPVKTPTRNGEADLLNCILSWCTSFVDKVVWELKSNGDTLYVKCEQVTHDFPKTLCVCVCVCVRVCVCVCVCVCTV